MFLDTPEEAKMEFGIMEASGTLRQSRIKGAKPARRGRAETLVPQKRACSPSQDDLRDEKDGDGGREGDGEREKK